MEFISDLSINDYKMTMVVWNVYLALIPCFIAYFLGSFISKKKWGQLKLLEYAVFILFFIIWFFFFPNTAYLFTMPRHLVDYCGDYDKYRVCMENAWMPIFFFVYALIGVPTFYYSLNKMSEILKVLNRKVELKSEVVEFGLIQDIEKEQKEANQGAAEAMDLMGKALPKAEKAVALNKKLLSKIEKTIKAANEVGAMDAVKSLEKKKAHTNKELQYIEKLVSKLNF